MRNLKKFLALVLAMMMTLSLMVTVNAASDFTDADTVNEKFTEAVDVLEGMGVFEGYDDGSFQPKGNITRAEVATIVYRLATGDAEGKQAHLWEAAAAKFTDVGDDHWALGAIGYCANNLLVLGYDDGTFGPNKNVSGIEALAMILRAVGYGKNNEFKGWGWDTNVYGVARGEGLLKNVDNTNYAGRLSQPATRELVAEVLFQAAQIPTVTYQYGSYNKYTTTVTVAGVPKEFNPSLGYRYYGLTKDTGIVLGNQATGEDDTLIGFTAIESETTADNQLIANANGSYTYVSAAATDADTADGNITVPFDAKTGLDMFGHKADVWYDGRANEDGYTINATTNAVEQDANKTYAIFDKAVLSDYVYAEGADLSKAGGTAADTKLGAAASAAGFSVKLASDGAGATCANTTANLSDRYSQFDTALPDADAAAATAAAKSPVNMYYLVSNNSGKTVDVAVSLSAEVGKITEKNTTAKDKYLTLGTTTANASAFTNATGKQEIWLSNLTPDSVQKIGEIVTAWEVVGTSFACTGGAAQGVTGADLAKVMYQLDAMKTVTKQVSSMKAGNITDGGAAGPLDTLTGNAITEVNFTDGTSMKLSGITRGSGTVSKIVSQALPIVTANNATDTAPKAIFLSANKEYVVYVDVLGRFVSMTTGDDISFIYGTFGDFEMGALGTGTNKYAITGVDENGGTVENHVLTAITHSGVMTKIVNDVTNTYNSDTNFPITKKDYGTAGTGGMGNRIKDGANTGFMITKDGQLSPFTGKKLLNADDTWTVNTAAVNLGVAKVESNSVEYLLTENTQFYVVEGSGTATLKVTPYKGIKAFLGSDASAEIDFSTGDDEVVFWTEQDVYGTTKTDSNHNVAKVILSDTNLTRWGASNMFYNFNGSDATGLTLPGAAATVGQYELYNNGVKGTYFIDTAQSAKKSADGTTPGTAWTATTDVEEDTFYNLIKVDEVNGTPIYKAVGVYVEDDLAYADGLNTAVEYHYVAVNNLNFAELKKGTPELIFNVSNAKICDVQYDDGNLTAKATGVTSTGRSKITTIAELNNAISVMNTAQGAPVYDLQVSVVYDSANVATIYITCLEPHT